MKTFIAFIQTISGKEWEIGEILCNIINQNPENEDCCSQVFHVKTFKDLKAIIVDIVTNVTAQLILIQLDAHSNSDLGEQFFN